MEETQTHNRLGAGAGPENNGNSPDAEPKAKKSQKPEAAVFTASQAKKKWPAFSEREQLPKASFDKHGKVTVHGAERYAFRNLGGGIYKLLAVYNSGTGIATRLVKVLKTNKRNNRGAIDRQLLKQMKLAGLPELTD